MFWQFRTLVIDVAAWGRLVVFGLVLLIGLMFVSVVQAQNRGERILGLREAEFAAIFAELEQCGVEVDRLIGSRYPQYSWLLINPLTASFGEMTDDTLVSGRDEVDVMAQSVEAELECARPFMGALHAGGNLAAVFASVIEMSVNEYLVTMADYANGAITRGQVITRMKGVGHDLELRMKDAISTALDESKQAELARVRRDQVSALSERAQHANEDLLKRIEEAEYQACLAGERARDAAAIARGDRYYYPRYFACR